MTPSQHLASLVEKSGLSMGDFAACLDNMKLTSLRRFMTGYNEPHEGIIEEAINIVDFCDWFDQLIVAYPELMNMHHKIAKSRLDPDYKNEYIDDTQSN